MVAIGVHFNILKAILLSCRNTISGRVISKSAIRTYDLDQHKLFYFDVMDESETLRVKAFDQQCDRLFQHVRIGEV